MQSGEIYGLFDPRTGALRYIGQTSHGARRRLNGHLSDAKRKPLTHVARWLRELMRLGMRPEVRVLETCADLTLIGQIEQRWIADARAAGENLTNLTDGGDGGALGWKPSEETKARWRARPNVWRGRKHTETSKRLMSEGSKRVWQQKPHLRIEQSLRHKGKTISDRVRRAVGEAARQHWSDPAYRRQQLESRAVSSKVVAGRRKQGDKLKGRTRDKAAVAKTAAACRKRVVDQFGTIYDSFDSAARALGVGPPNISAVVNGHRPHTRGFVFRLYTEPLEIAS